MCATGSTVSFRGPYPYQLVRKWIPSVLWNLAQDAAYRIFLYLYVFLAPFGVFCQVIGCRCCLHQWCVVSIGRFLSVFGWFLDWRHPVHRDSVSMPSLWKTIVWDWISAGNHFSTSSVSLPSVFVLLPSWALPVLAASCLYVLIVCLLAYPKQFRVNDQMSWRMVAPFALSRQELRFLLHDASGCCAPRSVALRTYPSLFGVLTHNDGIFTQQGSCNVQYAHLSDSERLL